MSPARTLFFVFTLFFAQLAAAASLSGTVFGDSAPLEGASATLYDSGQEALITILTSADGAYLFDDLSDGVYFLGVTPPAGSDYGASPLESITIDSVDVEHVVTLLSGAKQLSGYLKDPQGRPLDHVSLRVIDQVAGGNGVLIWTDALGYFEIGVTAGTYKFQVGLNINGHWDEATSQQLYSSYPQPDWGRVFYLGENTVVNGDTQVDLVIPLAILSGKTMDGNGVPRRSANESCAGVRIGYVRHRRFARAGI